MRDTSLPAEDNAAAGSKLAREQPARLTTDLQLGMVKDD